MIVDRNRLLNILVSAVRDALIEGRSAGVPGLGTFSVRHVPSRVEQTDDGSSVMIPPRDVVEFERVREDIDAAISGLVEYVASRLDVEIPEALAALDQFSAEVLSDVRTAGVKAVDGMGTFELSGESVKFDPEVRLTTVVNHRFAGLAPIPVDMETESSLGLASPEFALPEVPIAADVQREVAADARSGGSDEADLVQPAGAQEEHAEEAPPPAAADRPFYEPEMPPEESQAFSPPGSRPWAETDEMLESVRYEVESDDFAGAGGLETKPVVGDEEAAEHSRAQIAEPENSWNRPSRFDEPECADIEIDDDYAAESEFEREADEVLDFGATLLVPERVSEDDAERSEKEREPAGDGSSEDARIDAPVVVRRSRVGVVYWAAIPLLVVAIGVVLWFLGHREGGTQPVDRQSVQSSVAEADSRDTEQNAGATDLGADVAGGESENGALAEPAGQATTQWAPGSVDRAIGGYTIVVSSQPTERDAVEFARNMAERLEDLTLPVDVFRGTTQGQARYRVGVGQFATIDAATQEMDRLEARLPRGVWVLRIRSYM